MSFIFLSLGQNRPTSTIIGRVFLRVCQGVVSGGIINEHGPHEDLGIFGFRLHRNQLETNLCNICGGAVLNRVDY